MEKVELDKLDWIIVTDPVEQVSMDMEVINTQEEGTAQYMLAIPAYEEEEEEDIPEEEDDAAYIFKVCPPEEAEFWITEEYSDLKFSVTTNMTEEEFADIAEIFANSEEYDLEVDEDGDYDNE